MKCHIMRHLSGSSLFAKLPVYRYPDCRKRLKGTCDLVCTPCCDVHIIKCKSSVNNDVIISIFFMGIFSLSFNFMPKLHCEPINFVCLRMNVSFFYLGIFNDLTFTDFGTKEGNSKSFLSHIEKRSC